MIADLDRDGLSNIVMTWKWAEDQGRLVIYGPRGNQLHESDARESLVAVSSAVGDVLPLPGLEIAVYETGGNHIVLLDSQARRIWRSEALYGDNEEYWTWPWGGPALADLDGDGVTEIIAGSRVINADGSLRWKGKLGQGYYLNGPLSVVADLDLEPGQEVLAGNTLYAQDGRVIWHNRPLPDGFDAAADVNLDGKPEIVLVGSGNVYLLDDHGKVLWGPIRMPQVHIPGSGTGTGSAPSIADVTGDGRPEILVACDNKVLVLDAFGTEVWSYPIIDRTYGLMPPVAFDFDGDGLLEVLHQDENRLRMFAGPDGKLLWEMASRNGTGFDFPLVADVDNGGDAEIVIIGPGGTAGVGSSVETLNVIGDSADQWVNARAMWNQHAYSITNINDDGTIPANPTPSWVAHNTFRVNQLPDDQRFLAPDLVARRLMIDTEDLPGSVVLQAVIANQGSIVAVDIPVAFYLGDPGAGGKLLGKATTGRLEVGASESVTTIWLTPLPGQHKLWIVADDDGQGNGSASECDETNNTTSADLTLAASPTPTPARWKAHLPLLLHELSCTPETQPVDVVLLMDSSTSMAGEKLTSAIAAAKAFYSNLSLSKDRIALVSFNREAAMTSPFGAGLVMFDRALDTMVLASGTRLDRALDAGHELLKAHGRSEAAWAVILLTDGRQDDDPAVAEVVASAVRIAGIGLYAIGLGEDADLALLTRLTADPSRARRANDQTALIEVYRQIAGEIPCGRQVGWSGR